MIQKIKKLTLGGETRAHLFKTFFIYGFIALTIIFIKILIARLYGQEELGIFTYFFSLVSLVFLFTSFGIPDAITQIIIKNPHRLRNSLRHALTLLTPFTIFFILITITITTYTHLNPQLPYFNLAFTLYIVFYTLHYISYNILRGWQKFVSASMYSLLNRIFVILFIVLLALYLFPFTYVLISFSIALLIATVASIPQILKHFPKPQLQQSTPFKKFFILALSLFLMQVSFYSLRFADAITIKYLVDFTSLGLYSAYGSITNTIRLLGYVFPMVVVPMAAIHHYRLKQSLKRIFKLLIPFALLVLAGSYILVPILYGAGYSATYLPIALVISSTLLVLYSYFNSIFVGENEYSPLYMKILVADFAISLIINTLLNVLLISAWGIIGAPIATAITIIIKIALNIYGIKKLRIQNNNPPVTPQEKPASPSPDQTPQ